LLPLTKPIGGIWPSTNAVQADTPEVAMKVDTFLPAIINRKIAPALGDTIEFSIHACCWIRLSILIDDEDSDGGKRY